MVSWIGVSLSLCLFSRSAPFSTNKFTASMLFSKHAICRGVQPSSLPTFTRRAEFSPSFSMRKSRRWTSLDHAAKWRAVKPSAAGCKTWAPWSMSTWRTWRSDLFEFYALSNSGDHYFSFEASLTISLKYGNLAANISTASRLSSLTH